MNKHTRTSPVIGWYLQQVRPVCCVPYPGDEGSEQEDDSGFLRVWTEPEEVHNLHTAPLCLLIHIHAWFICQKLYRYPKIQSTNLNYGWQRKCHSALCPLLTNLNTAAVWFPEKTGIPAQPWWSAPHDRSQMSWSQEGLDKTWGGTASYDPTWAWAHRENVHPWCRQSTGTQKFVQRNVRVFLTW